RGKASWSFNSIASFLERRAIRLKATNSSIPAPPRERERQERPESERLLEPQSVQSRAEARARSSEAPPAQVQESVLKPLERVSRFESILKPTWISSCNSRSR